MNTTQELANHFRQVYFGPNWSSTNLKAVLADVSWQQAIARVADCNTIATLVNHMGYYITLQIRVLEGGPIIGQDSLSFSHPPIESEADWQKMLATFFEEAERMSKLIDALPVEQLSMDFVEAKYGSYLRNLFGVIEHLHYHMGQVVILKKVLSQKEVVE